VADAPGGGADFIITIPTGKVEAGSAFQLAPTPPLVLCGEGVVKNYGYSGTLE
jgi:hypothetical protein